MNCSADSDASSGANAGAGPDTNANADANLTRSEWARVHVLHDIVVQRKRGWARSGYSELVVELTHEARRLIAEGRYAQA